MLDLQFIRDNPELVATKSRQKGYEVDIKRLIDLDRQLREILPELEELQRQRNELASSVKAGAPTPEQVEAGKKLKQAVSDHETKSIKTRQELDNLLKTVPNLPFDDVPVGTSEADNKVVKEWGNRIEYDFQPKTHWEIAERRDLIDKQRAAKIAGSRFAYIKGDLVSLQFAVIQFVMTTLTNERRIENIIQNNGLNVVAKPFTPILPPAMINTPAYEATSRLDAEEVTYKLADDELWLNASAEHSLCNMYMNEILPEEMLPIRYIGYATSFRREAGTYGKDNDGILRMHQFDKLEMETFSVSESGFQEHLLLIAIQEYLVQQLNLPYQLIEKCSADIGKANARGFDINTWMPGQKAYRETHTADYMTDYQARRLKTRVRRSNGSTELVHTNDATAFALGRIMIAIMENNQTHDGHVMIPEVLQQFMSGKEEI